MGLLDQARADIVSITTDLSGFANLVTFTSPAGLSVTVAARPNKHHMSLGADGLPVSSKNASVSVAESVLVAAGYPIRAEAGEVKLQKHKVSWSDSTGNYHSYVINEWYPDETLGLIVCILGDFQ